MSDEARNSFGNLILLCHAHHNVVDKRAPEKFPPETLYQWKSTREADGQSALSGLRNITEDRLQELIATALEQQTKKVEGAIDKLESVDLEAAGQLREMMEEIETLRRSTILNPESVETLYLASRELRGRLDEDVVGRLYGAAVILSDLPSLAEHLESVARRLEHLSGNW